METLAAASLHLRAEVSISSECSRPVEEVSGSQIDWRLILTATHTPSLPNGSEPSICSPRSGHVRNAHSESHPAWRRVLLLESAAFCRTLGSSAQIGNWDSPKPCFYLLNGGGRGEARWECGLYLPWISEVSLHT